MISFNLNQQKILFQVNLKKWNPNQAFNVNDEKICHKFFWNLSIQFFFELFICKPEICETKSKVSRATKIDFGNPSKMTEVSSVY